MLVVQYTWMCTVAPEKNLELGGSTDQGQPTKSPPICSNSEYIPTTGKREKKPLLLQFPQSKKKKKKGKKERSEREQRRDEEL